MVPRHSPVAASSCAARALAITPASVSGCPSLIKSRVRLWASSRRSHSGEPSGALVAFKAMKFAACAAQAAIRAHQGRPRTLARRRRCPASRWRSRWPSAVCVLVYAS
jgi:hypothetical protein